MRSKNPNTSYVGILGRTALAICLCQAISQTAHAQLDDFDTSLANLTDAENYIAIFQGGGGNTLNINNPSSLYAHTDGGNIGIAGTGQLGLSGPLTINGNIDFAGAVTPSGYTTTTPPFTSGGPGGVVVNGTITGGHANVQADMNDLNSLSTILGGETGTSVALANGATINASSGVTDSHGNSVFTVSSINAPNGNLTISGSANQRVVINVSAGADANFHFNTITLLGGLTSHDVIFNFFGGSGTTLSGGPTLDINSNGGILNGIFLDPNGQISLVSSILVGAIYGGDTHNEQIVSGGTLVSQASQIPDAGSTALLLSLACGSILVLKRKFAVATA